MTDTFALALIHEATLNLMLILAVIIGPGLLVGLVVSIFQAATQINEQTLSFLPRLMVTLLSIVAFGEWILERLVRFFEMVFQTAPGAIG